MSQAYESTGNSSQNAVDDTESSVSRRSALRGIAGVAALGFVGMPAVTGSAVAQSAGSISYAPSDWTSAGPPVHSVGSSPAGALALNWDYAGLWGASWKYTTTAQGTGALTFDWTFSGHHSWYLSKAAAAVFADGPSGTTWQLLSKTANGFNVSGSATIQVNQGYAFGVRIDGYHYDSSRIMRGTFTLAPQFISLDIDVKPDSDENPINPNSKGKIPVAVFSTDDFDATSLDVSTLRFGSTATVDAGAGASAAHGGHVEDVDGDGIPDLVLHFPTGDTGFKDGDTEATLVGETHDGTTAIGADTVVTVGGKGKAKGRDR